MRLNPVICGRMKKAKCSERLKRSARQTIRK